MIQAPAAPVVATAVPVANPAFATQPVQQQQQQQQDMDTSDAPASSGFAEKAVLEAKVERGIKQERQATDVAWGIGLLVCIVIQYGLGFYEIGNALQVTSEKWDALDAKQNAGQCPTWVEGETAELNDGLIVYSLDGPSETGAPVVPEWAEFQSNGTCGAGDLVNWSLDPANRTCGPPQGHGFTVALEFSTIEVCPPPPTPIVEFDPDDGTDDGTDDYEGGTGRRMLRGGRRSEPAPPPPALEYAVVSNYSHSPYMRYETRDLGNAENWEIFTWTEAETLCDSIGARLCTADELTNGLGGGCSTLDSRFWAADKCDGGHVAASVSSSGLNDKTAAAIAELEMQCVADCSDPSGLRTTRRAVKCCADSDSGKDQGPRDFAAEAAAEKEAVSTHKTLQQKRQEQADGGGFSGGGFLSGMLAAVLGCMLLASGIGFAYIVALKAHPRCMVWTANVFFPAMLFIVGMWLMGIGLVIFGVILWVLAALAVCMIFCWREQIELTAKLLENAATVSLEDACGFISVKGILMVMELLITLPCLVFNVASYFQSADWKSLRTDWNDDCLDVCHFQYDSSYSKYFHHFMIIWIGMMFMEIMVHTIAGGTAMWYFHRKQDKTTYPPDYPYPASPALTALKWSLSSGFGSLAMAAFILTVVRIIVQMIREAERKAAEEGGPMVFVMCMLRCLAECIEDIIQFITKMSTIVVAITNDGFWPSCKRTMGMFYRCYYEGIMIERFTKITLFFFSLAVALVMFLLSYAILSVVLPDHMTSGYIPLVAALVVCIIAFLTLQLLAGGLLVIVNSIYVCYLIDLDNGYTGDAVTNEKTAELHAIYQGAIDQSIGYMGSGRSYKKSGAYRKQYEQQQR